MFDGVSEWDDTFSWYSYGTPGRSAAVASLMFFFDVRLSIPDGGNSRPLATHSINDVVFGNEHCRHMYIESKLAPDHDGDVVDAMVVERQVRASTRTCDETRFNVPFHS